MSYLHHWKTLLGTRWALKCHCWGRCCPDCVHSVQAALLSRSGSCRLCSRWDSCRKLLCALLAAASCRAFCTWGVSGAENSHTQELLGPFSSRLPTLSSWLWYLIICLGTNLSFTEGWCEIVWHKKTLHGVPSSVQTCIAPSRNTTFPSSRKPGGCFGWHAGIEAGLGVKALDKNYSGAVEHFGSFATVGLFPLTSDEISNSWWAALGFPVLQLCSVL